LVHPVHNNNLVVVEWRSESYFGRPPNIPRDKLRHLFIQFEETIRPMASADWWHGQVSCVSKEILLVGWKPPPLDWIALNTDGASRMNPGMAGGGGVVWDWNCKWLREFAETMRICSSVIAEFRALLRGLQIAKEKGTKKLIVNVDSTTVLGLLKEVCCAMPAIIL